MTPPLSAFAAVRRSSRTLHERLTASSAATVTTVPGCEYGDDVIHRWRKTLDRGGSENFARRLRWDGLEECGARAALNAESDEATSADWTVLLEQVCAEAASDFDVGDPAVDAASPIPFEEVLLPFVQVGRRRLRHAAPCIGEVLSPNASASLDRALLSELSAVAEQALFVDLSVARAQRGAASLSIGAPGRSIYLGFVNALRRTRLAPLITSYPVLARLLAVRTDLWVNSSAEFVLRANADAAAIGALFDEPEPGVIVALHTGRGDTHGGGRTVATVHYASGLTVMYKPRSVKIDLAFNGLLDWLRLQGLRPEQRVLRILDRGDYGWTEFVRPAPVENESDLRDYYERAGVLLCLSYVLGAGDLHAENLIAAGPHPVVVDLEMMMCAPIDAAARGADSAKADAQPVTNVLSSLLLPFWNVGPGGAVIFRGGGLGLENESLRSTERLWTFVNTDRMGREQVSRRLKPPTNVPSFAGRLIPPAEHTDDIVRGFNRCHSLLESRRADLAAPGGALHRFRGQRVRVMVRDTRIYSTALRGSLHPRYLHDGFERSMQLEVLRLSVLGNDERVTHWPAFDAEQRDLEDLDFPLFWTFTDSTTLHDSRGAEVGRCYPVSAYDQAVGRLARLDAQDREHQESLIRFIFAYSTGPIATIGAPREAPANDVPLDSVTALAEARAIAAALEALVIRGPDGSAQWVGVDREQKMPTLGLCRLRDRLYDGRAGVALFLSALDAVGATGHTELAADALRPLRGRLRNAEARAALPATIGIGAGLGVGGVVYTLTQIARLTGDSTWLDDARNAARSLTFERIAGDTVLEVLGGAAGAALALLSLHEMTGDRWVLDRAAACGQHLLSAAATEPVTGRRVWRLASANWGTGFAHGAGGIAAALLRLTTATGNERFADAAAEGFAFEETIPQAHRVATPHLANAIAKARDTSPWKQTWCNGRVGVSVGRAIYGAGVPDDVVEQAVNPDLTSSPDHVCCGTLGRAELLLVTGHVDLARALAGKVVQRARAMKSYHISRDVPEARHAPAFFQGLSGIGYQLLRTGAPERLRSVLAFQ